MTTPRRAARRHATPQTQPDGENPTEGIDDLDGDTIDDPDDLEARADAIADATYRNPGAWEWSGPDE